MVMTFAFEEEFFLGKIILVLATTQYAVLVTTKEPVILVNALHIVNLKKIK